MFFIFIFCLQFSYVISMLHRLKQCYFFQSLSEQKRNSQDKKNAKATYCFHLIFLVQAFITTAKRYNVLQQTAIPNRSTSFPTAFSLLVILVLLLHHSGTWDIFPLSFSVFITVSCAAAAKSLNQRKTRNPKTRK